MQKQQEFLVTRPHRRRTDSRRGRPSPRFTDATVTCPVLFLDLVGYSQRPIAEQLRAKQWLNCAILAAVRDLEAGDRIILDTGDGVAVNFLGNPEYALVVGLQLTSSLGDIDLDGHPIQARIGINLGPIRLVQDVNGQTNMIGDGINAAQRVMSFAHPGQILVSRSFHQLLVACSERYAEFFAYDGARVDKHARRHEIYRLVASPRELLDARGVPLVPRGGAVASLRQAAAVPGASPWLRHRRLGQAAALASTFVLGLTIASYTGGRFAQPPARVAVTSELASEANASQPPQPVPAVVTSPAAEVHKPSAGNSRLQNAGRTVAVSAPPRKAKKALPTAIRNDTAMLHLAVSPWGEVSVNGKPVGASPPLSSLELKPGAYRVEIRNGDLEPYFETLELKPGDAAKLRHRFTENTESHAPAQELHYARFGRS
jgi:class 3 adenylate cyclase